jgi:uncharacterized protein Yka (UPF0111/DUF47 family)
MNRWFLPDAPDVVAMLHAQSQITVAGIDALAAWAAGDAAQERVVREREHAADQQKRLLRRALRDAFTTPIDAEDLYTLSERLDAVLNGAKNLVREADVMATPPDAAVADMARSLAAGVHHLDEGIRCLARDDGGATAAADAAIKSQRAIEKAYRNAMSALLSSDDLREQMSRRELYRRCARLGDDLVEVAERVWYAVVKEA